MGVLGLFGLLSSLSGGCLSLCGVNAAGQTILRLAPRLVPLFMALSMQHQVAPPVLFSASCRMSGERVVKDNSGVLTKTDRDASHCVSVLLDGKPVDDGTH